MKKFLGLGIAFFMSCQNFGAQLQEFSPDSFWADEYTQKMVQFSNVYTPYARKFFGCPPEATSVQQCRPVLSVRDWKLEQEVIKAAEIWHK